MTLLFLALCLGGWFFFGWPGLFAGLLLSILLGVLALKAKG